MLLSDVQLSDEPPPGPPPGPAGGGGGGGAAAEGTWGQALRRRCLPAGWREREVDWLLVLTVVGVAVGMVGGGLLSLADPSAAVVAVVGFPGTIFLNFLKMLVLPLVAISISTGVLSLRETGSAMKRVARVTILFYAGTMILAVIVGVVLVTAIHPGRQKLEGQADSEAAAAAQQAVDPVTKLLEILANAVPPNIFEALANYNILGVITFSIFFSVMLSQVGDAGEDLVGLIRTSELVFTKMIGLVLWFSPLGVGSLVAAKIMEVDDLGASMKALSLYCVTVVLGLLVQGLVVLPGCYAILVRKSPGPVMKEFLPAFVTAFGTDSSAATMPVTIQCACKAGCAESVSNFVVPLGATINMNGTALYEALTVIFIAQLHGVDLGAGGTLVVCITATLAAIGAAAIPSAGLVTMLLVLQAVGMEEYASDIALIFTVDWLLDRCRTVVNVAGDAFCACVVQDFTHVRDGPPEIGLVGPGGGGGGAGAGQANGGAARLDALSE